ncbi:MAG: hypothetical protein IE913_08240 [Halothiobacillus sp.]|nr:hypothetical protein [Halothiobacillus sp.]
MAGIDHALLAEGVAHINARFGLAYDIEKLERLLDAGVLFMLTHPTHPAFSLMGEYKPLSGGRYLHIYIQYSRTPDRGVQHWLLNVTLAWAKEGGYDSIRFESPRKGWQRVFKNAEIGRVYEIGV